ncbi:hypothetical protein WR25_17297 [Diploscapter pachys]|uniref:Uncharacterized protein n=1 Tax=Diploscapter pachys TaxID=2018661 RepID=A0A2A2K7J4_9BILA|nr:hypothetical protein WR25_17297 [Diploscapter pachys]
MVALPRSRICATKRAINRLAWPWPWYAGSSTTDMITTLGAWGSCPTSSLKASSDITTWSAQPLLMKPITWPSQRSTSLEVAWRNVGVLMGGIRIAGNRGDILTEVAALLQARNVLPGDVTRALGGKEADSGRDLLGLAVPLHGNPATELLLLRQAVDEAWQYVVHADVLGRVTVGEQFGKGREPGTEHAGGRERRIRLEGGKGRDIDDGPALLPLHDRGHQAGRAHHVEEIHLHASVPVLVAELEHRCTRAMPGAVDQYIDTPPLLHHGIDQTLQVLC